MAWPGDVVATPVTVAVPRGLTWCREYVAVAAALTGPALSRRGLFETLFATARHSVAAMA